LAVLGLEGLEKTGQSVLEACTVYGTEGRLFADFTALSLNSHVLAAGVFEVVRIWMTGDVRPSRKAERWVNAILRKNEPEE